MLDSCSKKQEDSGQHEQRVNAAVPTSTEVAVSVLPARQDTTPEIPAQFAQEFDPKFGKVRI